MTSISKLSHVSTLTKTHGSLTPQLIEEQKQASSTTTRGSYGPHQRAHQQSKLYHPKYPSSRAQQRRIRQVLVPKHMVQAHELCEDDEHRWVERRATTTVESSGWLSTQRSLEAQGYNYSNRQLWLPTPEFIAYKVHSNKTNPRRTSQRKRTRTTTQKSKQKHSQAKQRRQRLNTASTFERPQTSQIYVKEWIPKDQIFHMSAGDNNFVRIIARNKESKAYKQWIVPQNLVSAQGYYEGQAKIWIPKALLHSQTSRGPSQEGKLQSSNQIKQQWKPKKDSLAKSPRSKDTTSQRLQGRQSGVLKTTNNTATHQVTAVEEAHKWVPKLLTADKPTTIPKASQQATSLQEAMPLKAQEQPLPTNEPNVLSTVAVVKPISNKGKDSMKVSNPPDTSTLFAYTASLRSWATLSWSKTSQAATR